MTECTTCGSPNLENARFCNACGAPLGEPVRHLRKTITSLFCDLVGSTPLAESLADPEAIHDVLTAYLRAMTAVIQNHGGEVEKFAGDAILGTFGAPVSHEDDAVRAVRAAVGMREALNQLNADLQARWDVMLQIKIGINSGEVLTGDTVAGQAMALGDPVNVAARLEQTAGPGEIVLGETTVRLLGASVSVDGPQLVTVKGKAEPLASYRLISLTDDRRASFAGTMVGRGTELSAIQLTHERVLREGNAAAVLLIGEAGIGKSRLALAFTDSSDASVLTARCPSYGAHNVFRPIVDALRTSSGLDGDAVTVIERLVDAVVEEGGERLWLISALASMAGAPPTDGGWLDPADAVRAWALFFERAAAARRVVLLVEDLHWADDALVQLLARLATIRSPLLVLCTARPEFESRLPASFAPTVVHLEPLTPEETAAVVRGVAALSRDQVDEIVRRAGGNPLFAEALAGAIADGAQTEGIPGTVEALVAARLDALPTSVRPLVLDASVMGTSIRVPALAAMLGRDEASTGKGIEQLIDRGLLRPATDGYGFWNEVVRDVAYRQIPRAARVEKHNEFASWLEANDPEVAVEVVAHHVGEAFDIAREVRAPAAERADLAARAARLSTSAAGSALRAADPGAARRFLARAGRALRETVDPDRDLIGETGRLLVALGAWHEAVELLTPHAASDHTTIQRELGIAMCKLHRDDPGGAQYTGGQAHLERAAARDDLDAIASLAGTWKGIDEQRVLSLYRRASEIDPTDPYPLGNLLEYEIRAAGDPSPVAGLRQRIAAAMDRCRAQERAGLNLPWALYDLGKFHLVLGSPYEALDAYARAVDLSPAPFMVETSRVSLRGLSTMVGPPWCEHLLTLALRARFDEQPRRGEGSVVVLAGATAAERDAEIAALEPTVLAAFDGFGGVVISGGTVWGVSGLAGAIGARHAAAIRVVGYLPAQLPSDVELDPRFHEVRRTPGDGFSPLEPLTYWRDLLDSGTHPAAVRVLGIGGGAIAATEYAIAIALGASVGILEGSGGAADRTMADPHWSASRRLEVLEPTTEQISTFIRA